METVAESDLPLEQLRAADGLLDAESALPADLMALGRWAIGYYHHPPGEVFSALFPRRLREGKPRQPPGEPGWRLTTRALGLPEGALRRSPKQAQALQLLRQDTVLSKQTMSSAGISPATLRALADKELVERCTLAESPGDVTCREGPSLGAEQGAVVQTITHSGQGFTCHLLEGVTGSGKTEVYLQLIAQCLRRKEQVLVLIPEIGLTPQTVNRFAARFAANIAVLHSGLSEAQRYKAWEAAHAGTAHIVIGTRSAVFTPLASPGLIIVDEEHDGSYKQQDGFRYCARDVAVKRAQLLDCPIVLGSATPSLESMHNALTGRYVHHRLTRRAGAAQMPDIAVLDVRKQALTAGLSDTLLEACHETLSRKEQVLLFLNRRGYAPVLQCHDCGWIAECDACDARMTIHRQQRRLRCHHCGAQRPLVDTCPSCGSRALQARGLGTEQTEAQLRAQFTQHPVYRVDSDSMQGRDSMAALLKDINREQPAILIGTQMLAKGHHFPAVTLVAVLDVDAMLFSADFRGEERMAQLLTQVAGRAGRDRRPGRVLLQSHYPHHPYLQSMLEQDYLAQAEAMLALRRQGGLPPFGQMLIVRADCTDADHAENFLSTLRRDVTPKLDQHINLIGPLPSPVQRRAGRHHFQLLASAPARRSIHRAATQLVACAEALPNRKGLKWSVDIDPRDLF